MVNEVGRCGCGYKEGMLSVEDFAWFQVFQRGNIQHQIFLNTKETSICYVLIGIPRKAARRCPLTINTPSTEQTMIELRRFYNFMLHSVSLSCTSHTGRFSSQLAVTSPTVE